MIDVRQLVKRYGDRAALDGVTFRVERGEVVGFLGPNGAGKTTTLRILSTYLTPDGGSATVAGFDVARRPMDVRRRIGYLPEHPPLDLDHTVREYLGFCAALRGVTRARAAAVSAVIDRCGLRSVAGRLIGNLSKGFRQRVGLAQALVHAPEVVVLDEPTVGLDPSQIREIRQLIRSLAGDHTVLLSSHILPEVAMTCSRAVVIHQGRVAADLPVDAAAAGGRLETTFLSVTATERAAGDEVPA
ncbi:MAG TPA: ABC transporter ATP-binding protein [Candidatus Polarisedimenticolaceae bacterium]|nr:ABC transporter ATP-binding protein [Candidatus Polarisedimenticolaceae bacterium]